MSVQTIILNSTNYNIATDNFIYDFSNHKVFTERHKIAIASISMYNSTYNITSTIGNNTFSIYWLGTTYNFTIPDGYYSASDLNFYIQKQCILNNLYLIDGENFIYFFEITENVTEYSININYYQLPTEIEASTLVYSIPSDATWSLPTDLTTEYIYLTLSSNLAKMLGFTYTQFPQILASEDTQSASDIAPNLQYSNSVIIACNLCNSKYSFPSNIIYSIPIDVGFGLLLKDSNSKELIYTDINPGAYRYLEISFLNQFYEKLQYRDKNILLLLSIKEVE